MSQPQNIVRVDLLNFPQRLLITNEEYPLDFQVINLSSSAEEYQIKVEGENIDVLQSKELSKEIKFNPSETKKYQITLKSKVDGQGKLIVNVTHMKRVKYTVKVQKVREVVSISKINEIFGKEYISSADMEEIYMKSEYLVDMSDQEIEQDLKALELPDQPPVADMPDSHSFASEYSDEEPDIIIIPTSSAIPEVDPNTYSSPERKQEIVRRLTKAYVTRKEVGKALKMMEKLTNIDERWELYSNLIRAYAPSNIQDAIEYAGLIPDTEKKENLLKNIALDRVSEDAEQASRIALLIEDPKLKEGLLTEILFQCTRYDPVLAIKISNLIEDLTLRILVLFEICSALLEKEDSQNVLWVIQRILQALLSAKTFDLKKNDFVNFNYNLFLNAVHALAELSSPQAADDYINSLEDQQLKEKLATDLFNIIYKLVDEERIKIDPNLVYYQFFLINCYVSPIFEKLQEFVAKNGNISENILQKTFNFNAIITNLFGYSSFSTFPFFDRIYNEIKEELKKTFGLYIFPVRERYGELESVTMVRTLEYFLNKNVSQMNGNIYIFNVDFIPYLTAPTIIMGSNPAINDEIQSKVNQILGNRICFVVDDGVFKGGQITEQLKSMFPEPKFKIINLVLSYEILNNYTLFKDFIKAFI